MHCRYDVGNLGNDRRRFSRALRLRLGKAVHMSSWRIVSFVPLRDNGHCTVSAEACRTNAVYGSPKKLLVEIVMDTSTSSLVRQRTATRRADHPNVSLARASMSSFGGRKQVGLSTLSRKRSSTDCLCRRGAAMQNLSHSASLQAWENNAPSNVGIKQQPFQGGTNGKCKSLR